MADLFSYRPMCDTKGCDNGSVFNGYGKRMCKSCYSKWLAEYRCRGALECNVQLNMFEPTQGV